MYLRKYSVYAPKNRAPIPVTTEGI